MADLRLQEVTRALRALSAAYVDRRGTGVRGALDSPGKRAAFALYYAPLHFLTTHLVVGALGAETPPPRTIVDIGCGTGAAAAAWALAAGGTPSIAGIDRHPWAVAEANWTYRQLGLRGRARLGDVARLPPLVPGSAAIAAYVLNELPEPVRTRLEARLMDAAARGTRVLIIEPIARRVAPWWDEAASLVEGGGGRADEWRFAVELPPFLERLDRAAGLDHHELTARSLYCPGRAVNRLEHPGAHDPHRGTR
ncbi:MAG: hypothetical protein A3I61_13005 [Acidobacteria bacterium RIFCSPLOWO2_02_FULL_68_18]|nr:MAG: hypothetical protein A3I61_13005 [Acidobacteria bacterium RIFCSPLOWO2_02_FULL_68_18]OFW51870.1 MAG: hypothetical protein A3G77_00650 [Acidobacteria bacterium RIFCSPLOWO2_12_FULL_68_19]